MGRYDTAIADQSLPAWLRLEMALADEPEKDPACGTTGCSAHDGECRPEEPLTAEQRFDRGIGARLNIGYETYLSQ